MSAKKRKISSKSIWVTLLSMVMIGGFIVLFVAASNDKKEGNCKGIVIAIDGADSIVYVDTANIRKQLLKHKQLNPINKPLAQVDIPLLEQSVNTQDWVKNTEAYFGNHNLLYLKIKQRTPVARIFTEDGKNFYLAKSGEKIPALGKFAIRLPVFTGFSKKTADSTLITQIKQISEFITGNAFWMAQIEQIEISRDNGFEITPQLGDVLVVFGRGYHISEKFNKLMTFYKEGLNNVGWGYYDTLDIRFDRQVVASRKRSKGNPVIKALVTHNDPDNLKEARKKIAENNSTFNKTKPL